MRHILGSCSTHDFSQTPDGYITHMNWMTRQHKEGKRQRQCPKCKIWLFPCEWKKSRRKP